MNTPRTRATTEARPTIPAMLPKALIADAAKRARATSVSETEVLSGCLHQGIAAGYTPALYNANVGETQYMRLTLTTDERKRILAVAKALGVPGTVQAGQMTGYGAGVDEVIRQFIEFGMTKRPPAGLPDPAGVAKRAAAVARFKLYDLRIPKALHDQLYERTRHFLDTRTGIEAVRAINAALQHAMPITTPSGHSWGMAGVTCTFKLPTDLTPTLEDLGRRHGHIEVSEVLRRLIIAGFPIGLHP